MQVPLDKVNFDGQELQEDKPLWQVLHSIPHIFKFQ